MSGIELQELNRGGFLRLPLEEFGHELDLFELARELYLIWFKDGGLFLHFHHELGHALFKHFGDLRLYVLRICPNQPKLLLDQVDLVMNKRLLILQGYIIILRLVKSIVVRDLDVDQIVVPSILLSEPCQYTLWAISILTAVAVELVLSSRMLIAAAIVFPSQIYIHSPMRSHDFGEVVLQEVALMGVHITLITEVSVIVFAKLGGLWSTWHTVLNLMGK